MSGRASGPAALLLLLAASAASVAGCTQSRVAASPSSSAADGRVPDGPAPCADLFGGSGPVGRTSGLYCLPLLAAPGFEAGPAFVELRLPASPFGIAVTSSGHQRYDLTLITESLPEPQSLGAFTRYAAWLAPMTLAEFLPLGDVVDGELQLGESSLNQFLVLISAEGPHEEAEHAPGGRPGPRGPVVLRGQSPSARLRRPDLLDFLLGASDQEAQARHVHGDARADTAAAGGETWPTPPMPPGLTMLPALMQLSPKATPYRLRSSDYPIPPARPRQLVRLADGDTLRLEAAPLTKKIRGRELVMLGFNGQIPGPLIEVDRQATVIVNLVNHTRWPATVHWHGVRLENRYDGVPGVTQDPVPPGGSFIYKIHFPDAGIYWYHPHHREDVLQDLGLYGNMLVRSERAEYYGPANREEVLMLDDLLIGGDGLFPYGREEATHSLMGRFGNLLLINGEPEYSLRVDRGEVVRFFFTNASNTRTFNLSVPGAALKVVGSDVGNFEHEEWVESVVIAPAERYVVHARFDDPGSYSVLNRVQGIDHIGGRFLAQTDTLGTVEVRMTRAEPDLSDVFRELRTDSAAVREIDRYRHLMDRPVDHELLLTMETRDLPFVVQRLIQLDSVWFPPVEWSGTMPMMNLASTPSQVAWTLRDAATGLENLDIDWQFEVGDVVKIRITNRRDVLHGMQHPIHLHGQRFLVLSVGGVPNENLVWKDTMLLPVGTSADILLELSNPGQWMLHCHIAEHLESGMKTVFTVH
ncbi:MAG: multicopper oxidase family protein [Gemmatimonadota bacterium]